MEPLYEHQKKIIQEDKKRTGIFQGTGSGKTRSALELARGSTLVVCPKQQKLDKTWERNSIKFGIVLDLTVISKEVFKRDWEILPYYDTLIIDECHNNLGVLPDTRQRNNIIIPKTSQIFEATLGYLKKHKPERFYPCSATPVTKPFHLWALATLFGENWNYYQFRDKYYFQIKSGFKQIWIPIKSEKLAEKLASLVKSFGYTGSLFEFADVPEQTHTVKYFDLTPKQKEAMRELELSEADPLVKRSKMRTIENGILYKQEIVEVSEGVDKMVKSVDIFPSEKIDYILEKAIEFPKMIIFANYTAQINEIARVLRAEGYTVTTLTGKTKDRSFLPAIDVSPEPHILVAQSSVSSGWEFKSCPCVIFASKSWRYLDYEQGIGRVLRANHLKKNLYIHLVVDGADGDCHDAIMSGQDFQEKVMHLEDVDIDVDIE